MDINKLLKGTHCECGKHHTCDIKYVYIEKLPALTLLKYAEITEIF